MVITLDSESDNPSSILGMSFLQADRFLTAILKVVRILAEREKGRTGRMV